MSLTKQTFSKYLSNCFQKNTPQRILLALSGGVDSMCLAHLLLEYRRHNPQLQLFAATIDHAYRAESASEAIKVQKIVEGWGYHHEIKKLSYCQDPKHIDNFEEVARTLRYQNFRDICLKYDIETVAVAHNLDDCLETFLQRLLMNSTMYGLSALRPWAPMPIERKSPDESIQILRPLLEFSKDDIRSYCLRNEIQWFEDQSNHDITLTQRNKLRYMINVHVPSISNKRPETSIVSKEKLTQTLLDIHLLVSLYESEQDNLDKIIKLRNYFINDKNCTVSFSVPSNVWSLFENEVTARWLYDTIYPMSSSKHFHWSYAKVERQVVVKIKNFVALFENITKFNYLGVVFSLKKNGELLQFELSKQPPVRQGLRLDVEVPKDGRWILFDRTWWFRAPSSDINRCGGGLILKWYRSSMKKELLSAFPELKKGKSSLNSRIGIVPVLVNSRNNIVGLPTHNLYLDGIKGECLTSQT